MAGHDVARPHLGGEPERGIDVGRADEGDADGCFPAQHTGGRRPDGVPLSGRRVASSAPPVLTKSF